LRLCNRAVPSRIPIWTWMARTVSDRVLEPARTRDKRRVEDFATRPSRLVLDGAYRRKMELNQPLWSFMQASGGHGSGWPQNQLATPHLDPRNVGEVVLAPPRPAPYWSRVVAGAELAANRQAW
jgi:hypothetical protein